MFPGKLRTNVTNSSFSLIC